MTDQSYQAGRELDALVAEKVFGTKVHWSEGQRPVPCDGEPYYTSDSENPGGYYLNALPAYSTDIAAAWAVRATVNTWLFSKRLRFKKSLQEIITVRIGLVSSLQISPCEVILRVEPSDICLAALKAVGVLR
jgi:hypothetical protein